MEDVHQISSNCKRAKAWSGQKKKNGEGDLKFGSFCFCSAVFLCFSIMTGLQSAIDVTKVSMALIW